MLARVFERVRRHRGFLPEDMLAADELAREILQARVTGGGEEEHLVEALTKPGSSQA